MLRLNVGCGQHKRQGYINIDIQEGCNPDVVADVLTMDYEIESVDEIYASNILEHNSLDRIENIFNNFWKWLKYGGALFISVPNLVVICDFISRGYTNKILWNWLYGDFDAADASGHKWGFTEETLNEIADNAGFKFTGYFEGQKDDSGFIFENQYLSLNVRYEK